MSYFEEDSRCTIMVVIRGDYGGAKGDNRRDYSLN